MGSTREPSGSLGPNPNLDSQQNRNDRLDFFFVYLLHGRLGRRALMGVPESDMQDVLSDGE